MRVGADDELAGSDMSLFDHDIMTDAALITFVNDRAMLLGKLLGPLLTFGASRAARRLLIEIDDDLVRIPGLGDTHLLEDFFEYTIKALGIFRFRKPQVFDVKFIHLRVDHVSGTNSGFTGGSRANLFSDSHPHIRLIRLTGLDWQLRIVGCLPALYKPDQVGLCNRHVVAVAKTSEKR